MKADRASRTAQMVTMGRALADAGISNVPDFHDPTARFFLTATGKKKLAKAESAVRAGKTGIGIKMARVSGDMISLRTLAIDAAVRNAIARGAKQLVILGAGYDGRAWRMSELEGVKVFEVDHPATQNEKRAQVSELPAAKGIVAFVSINFETESFEPALERAGHDRSTPTCWIWEGVVMYLTHRAMRETLASIGALSAPRSTLIVNYHTPHRALIAALMFRFIGEPQIGEWTSEEMATELQNAGFTVTDDTGMADWNARFAENAAIVHNAGYMRIAVAAK